MSKAPPNLPEGEERGTGATRLKRQNNDKEMQQIERLKVTLWGI